MEDKAIIFLHIPKTAGNTIHYIVHQQYEPQMIYAIRGPSVRESQQEFMQLSRQEKQTIRFLSGHVPFGIHESLPGQSTYITLLRDPVDRIVSHYYYVLRSPEHYLYHQVTSQNMALKDYVESGISTELNNGQTKMIAGIEQKIEFGKCSSEFLVRAKQNIEQHFALVGFVERFDETIMLLKHQLGWKKIPFYKKPRNVTRNRPRKHDIPVDTLHVIEKYNTLDLELYEYASHRFDQFIHQQPLGFKIELAIFRGIQPYYHSVKKSNKRLASVYQAGKSRFLRFVR